MYWKNKGLPCCAKLKGKGTKGCRLMRRKAKVQGWDLITGRSTEQKYLLMILFCLFFSQKKFKARILLSFFIPPQRLPPPPSDASFSAQKRIFTRALFGHFPLLTCVYFSCCPWKEHLFFKKKKKSLVCPRSCLWQTSVVHNYNPTTITTKTSFWFRRIQSARLTDLLPFTAINRVLLSFTYPGKSFKFLFW